MGIRHTDYLTLRRNSMAGTRKHPKVGGPPRMCKKCKHSFTPIAQFKTNRHWFPGTCEACRYKKNKKMRDPQLAAATHSRWRIKAISEGRYDPNYGTIGRWYSHPPSLRLYKKLRRSGIPKDEARTEALLVYRRTVPNWNVSAEPSPAAPSTSQTLEETPH